MSANRVSANSQFELGYPMSLSLRGKVFNSREMMKEILPVMNNIVHYQNNLLKLMLILRGEKYTLDGQFFSQKDVDRQFGDLCKEHNIKGSICSLKEKSRKLYEVFSCYIDKKGNLKTNSKARSFAGVLLNPKDVKLPPQIDSISSFVVELRAKGVLPIKHEGNYLSGHPSLKYSVAQNVLVKLTSMEKLQKIYSDEKAGWENIVSEVRSDLPKIERYERMLLSIKAVKEMEKFGINNYRHLLNNWRDEVDKDSGKVLKQGMRTYFVNMLESKKDYRFEESDRYLFGYAPEVMNLVYHDFRDLWQGEDIIGSQSPEKKDRDYVDVIFNYFNWRKESINISSFDSYGKTAQIKLGDNYVPFSNFQYDKILDAWTLEIANVSGEGDNHKLVIARSPQFDSHSSVKDIVMKNLKGKEASKTTLEFRYSGDSKKSTWYRGTLKEPTLRYSSSKNCLYVDFALSNHIVEGLISDNLGISDKMYKFRGEFMKASPSSGKQSNSINLPIKKLRAMGVDFNLRRPFQASIYDVENKNGNLEFSFVKHVQSFSNENDEERAKELLNIERNILALKILIWQTVGYVTGKNDTIDGVVTRKNNAVDIEKTLGINMKEYMAYLNQFRSYEDKNKAFMDLRKREYAWIVPPLIFQCRSRLISFRSEYFNTPKDEKSHYCQHRNFVDYSTFLKKNVVKKMMELRRSYSTFGMSSEQSIWVTNNDHAKDGSKKNGNMFDDDLHQWYNGLVRKCSSLASSIINVARDNGAILVFIEDLDCHPSAFDSEEDNSLKSIWGWGSIKASLAHQARKHNIAVVANDPHLTSLVSSTTGELGIAKGRDVLFFDSKGKLTSKVNRDENAAQNIAIRGFVRHSDLREFVAEKIEENRYRVVVNKTHKRKAGAIYRHIGSTECIMSKQADGSLKIDKTELTPLEIKMEKKNDKKMYVILHGKTWRLRHELNEKLEKDLDNHLKSKSSVIS